MGAILSCVHSSPQVSHGTEKRTKLQVDTEGGGSGKGEPRENSLSDTELSLPLTSPPTSGGQDAEPLKSTSSLNVVNIAHVAQVPGIELQWISPTVEETERMVKRVDEIKQSVVQQLGSPLTVIGLFDSTYMWYKSPTGAFTPSLLRQGTFCQALFEESDGVTTIPFTIQNAPEDPRFCNHPSVINRPNLQGYAGCPMLSRDGHFLGTVAVVELHPHDYSEEDLTVLKKAAKDLVYEFQLSMFTCLKAAAGNPDMPDADVVLPSLVLDVSDLDHWKVVSGNEQWEQLTGISVEDLKACGTLWDALMPGEIQEFDSLKQVVQQPPAFGTSVATILCPIARYASSLQLLLSLSPVDGSDNKLWTATVHGRIGGRPQQRISRNSGNQTTTDGAASVFGMASKTFSTPIEHGFASDLMSTGGDRNNSSSRSTNGSGGASRTSGSAIQIPPRLSTLRVGDLLAKGSYGNVYNGYLKDQPVAIKVVECDSGSQGSAQAWDAQFEAILSLDLHHPNVVPTLDFYVYEAADSDANAQVWLVQPLCDMGSLGNAISSGKLRLDSKKDTGPDMVAVLATAREIASALQYLHFKSMLHGDLSSNNVLLTSDETERGYKAVVVDFGLSRIIKNKDIQTKTVGTVSHMAPELLMDGVMTRGGDVYSFGVLIWEMYCGQKAWAGSSLAHVIYSVTCKGEKLKLPEDAPEELAKLVDDCMQEDRLARPPFDEIVERLSKMSF